MNEKITIDQEFKDLLPVLSGDEKQALEDSIIAEGCREPLVIWQHEGKNILVDGHNRYEICQKHRKQYETKAIPFKDREAVKVWILQNQCARRNLNKDQKLTVAKRMVASGISQKDIAKALGVSQQWVSEKTRIVQEVRKEATQEAIGILKDAGKSNREIAKDLNIPKSTVSDFTKSGNFGHPVEDAVQVLSSAGESQRSIAKQVGVSQPKVNAIMQNTISSNLHKESPITKTEAENKASQMLSSNSILAKAEKLTESKPIIAEPIQQKAELPKDKCSQCEKVKALEQKIEELKQDLKDAMEEIDGLKERLAPYETEPEPDCSDDSEESDDSEDNDNPVPF